MATSAISVRMEDTLKQQVDEIASTIGLSTAAVFNVFAKQFVAHRGFPFAVVEPVPTEREFTARMDAIYESMTAGSATEHELLEA